MLLLSRYVSPAHAPQSFSLLQVHPKLGRCFGARPLVYDAQAAEEGNRGERPQRMDDVEELLRREWLMPGPSTRITRISVLNPKAKEEWDRAIPSQKVVDRGIGDNMHFANSGYLKAGRGSKKRESTGFDRDDESSGFYVIRDDLLHPLLGGNKLRKLDALMPELERMGATDVVTCGGCQSAHTAAIAFACAERGMSAHLLLRGERPAIPTGYNLLSGMYGQIAYIPRSEYADRADMLSKHASKLAGPSDSVFWLDDSGSTVLSSVCSGELSEERLTGGKKMVAVVKEGAGDAIALLGLIRLVHYLCQPTVFGAADCLHIVVDTGTGTTAVGVALGVALLGLPWKVTGVMLADSAENYKKHQLKLVSDFSVNFPSSSAGGQHLPLQWEQRLCPRKFGKVLPGEIEICQSIARQTGILLDPIYTLAGWETAVKYYSERKGSEKVVMLHTGGTLGLFGLAQRFPAQFGSNYTDLAEAETFSR